MGELHILPLRQEAVTRLAKIAPSEVLLEHRAKLELSLAHDLAELEREITETAVLMQELRALPNDDETSRREMSQRVKGIIEDLTRGGDMLRAVLASVPR